MARSLKYVTDFGDLNHELREIYGNFPQIEIDSSGNTVLVGVDGLQIRLQPANTLAVIGDSIFSQGVTDIQTGASRGHAYLTKGPVTHALELSHHRLSIVYFGAAGGSAVTGDTGNGTPFMTQLESAIASGATNIIVMGGENDVITRLSTADELVAGWIAFFNRANAAGIKVWWCTCPYFNAASGNYSVLKNGTLMAVNDRVKRLINSQYAFTGIECIDTASKVVNPSNATGDWNSNLTYDNQHPRNIGAYWMGKEIARVWNLFFNRTDTLLNSAADNYTYSALSTNILVNGLFTAGAAPGTGWAVSGSGATSTDTLVARSDGFGNDLNMAITYAAGNATYEVRRNDYKTRISNGDTIYAECEVTVESPVGLRGVELHIDLYGSLSINYTSSDGVTDIATDVSELEGYTKVLRTKPFLYDSSVYGTINASSCYVNVVSHAAGSVTVKVGRVSIRKIIEP